MRPTRIAGADPVPLGAPPDWDEATAGHCSGLFIRREEIAGVAVMRSAWEVDAAEAIYLFAGSRLTLGVSGDCHPVVSLGVDPLPPDFEPVMTARRYLSPDGVPMVRVEMLFPYGGGQRAFANVALAENDLAASVAQGVRLIEAFALKHGWTD